MKKRRKIGLLWVLPVLTAVLAACGSAGTAETMSSIKIGVTLYDQYDTYVSELMESFNSYATQKAEETGIAINVEVYNAANSQSTQDEQVEKMIEDDCDVICVNLVDRTEPTVIIDQAEKIRYPSFSLTGNWWRKIWSVGISSIMSVRTLPSPASCRASWW